MALQGADPSLVLTTSSGSIDGTNYSVNTAQESTRQYQELAKYLFVKFLDGNIKKEKDGKFERNKWGSPVQPKFGGYTQDYFNTIVKGSGDYLRVKEVEK